MVEEPFRKLDSLEGPRSNVEADEAESSESHFDGCKHVLSEFSRRRSATAQGITYTHSDKWGHIMRAILVYEKGDSNNSQFICWVDKAGMMKFSTSEID